LTGTALAAGSPKAEVRSTIDAILGTLRDNTLSGPGKKAERRDRIKSLISNRFDFKEMSKRSLARHWKERSDAEKKQFVSIFSDLLQSSYISKIESYSDEVIQYDKEEIKGKGKYGVVSTTINTKDVDIPIEYKVLNRGGKWWVYDVVIEGVSFISTYRNQYNKIIIKESFAKLIHRMQKKLDDLNASM
jgi:phospholipid transport system substrate-binding protein